MLCHFIAHLYDISATTDTCVSIEPALFQDISLKKKNTQKNKQTTWSAYKMQLNDKECCHSKKSG